MKIRKPVTGHFNLKQSNSDLCISVVPHPVAFNSPAMFHIVVNVLERGGLDLLYELRVQTLLSKDEVSLGLSSDSIRPYGELSYVRGVEFIRRRLDLWSGGDIDVARALTCLAARDADHPFWWEDNI